jgi:protein-S-isoprenylcysteine O-methyltransferase Ste14
MNQDALFRPLMIVGLLVTLAIALPYRLKSQATREPLDRREEGLFILATLRPVGVILWLSVFAYLINPAWLAWSSVAVPVWVRWVGAAVWPVSAAMLYWTMSTLGPNLTDTVVTRKAATLVTRGPYRWIRHPFYGSVTLLMLAMALLAANWFLLLAGSLVVGLLVMRTDKEEDLLVARFGDAYRDYMSRTGRFFPRFAAARARAS